MSSKFFSILMLMCIAPFAQAQDNIAQVLVKCMDTENNPLIGEQIWFQNKSTSKIHKGTITKWGNFTIELEGPNDYIILVKSVGEALPYTEISIPALNPGESYGTMEIIVQIDPPREFTLDNVFFETGKSSLKDESFAELDELFDLMTSKESLEIEIAGHTDDVGNESDNINLSQKRSESVRSYLVSKGISAQRIIAKGYGESRPIADNNTQEGRQINRRTEVKVLKE